MKKAPVYRHSDTRQQLALGLEAPDLFALLLLFGFLMIVQRHAFFLDTIATAFAYLAIRVAKRGKAPGYTSALARYSARASARRLYLAATLGDFNGRHHPFPVIAGPPARESIPIASGTSTQTQPAAPR
jgi:hypothetical protein